LLDTYFSTVGRSYYVALFLFVSCSMIILFFEN
jgi:hypothetical protein